MTGLGIVALYGLMVTWVLIFFYLFSDNDDFDNWAY